MLWSGEPTLNLTIYFQRGGSELHYDACFPKTVLPRGKGVHYRGKYDYAEIPYSIFSPVEDWLMFIIVIINYYDSINGHNIYCFNIIISISLHFFGLFLHAP